MDHGHGPHSDQALTGAALSRTAFSATLHCALGCMTGEIAGMLIGTALGLGNWATVALSVVLAFITGYSLTLRPLLKAGLGWRRAMGLAFAADTLSIATMEVVDNGLMLVWPGAMSAGLGDPLFWISLAVSTALGGVAAYPVNRWLIGRGQGHAVVHAWHHG